ncbi:MAG: phosphoribosylformylglycinamidine synthase subunit PurL [Phycisphaerae bacterium]
MNIWRIEISRLTAFNDPHAQSILHDVRDFGIDTVGNVHHHRIFLITSDAPENQIRQIVSELLVDAVSEQARIELSAPAHRDGNTMEVHRRPGVMDPAALSTESAIRKLGIDVEQVRTARMYIFEGTLGDAQKNLIASKIIANECIEQVVFGSAGSCPAPQPHEYKFNLRHVPLLKLGDEGLTNLSKKADLFLNLPEMKAIQNYFSAIGRDPTDIELESIAQTWSEHCVHKTLKSDIEYFGPAGKKVYKNLLKSTIAKATEQLRKKWCISVFVDNAGVIEFDDNYGICFKVETHNHPSAIEPYGGASTGIGGVIRDPLGTGLGAKPIANTDVFCFARPDYKLEDLPKGVLHPRRVFKGVVSGVRDYGNRMGIPTINGAIWFDDRYLGNPLVYCGNIGLLPRDKCTKASAHLGDYVVVVGGKTGRDGIHGATFSSGELTDRSDQEFSHAVQIGNAITEKKVVDVVLQARDHADGCLYSAITDCGAGGLSSAVGEMGENLGAEVDLEKIPLKYQGLRYDEIWISEAQERMVIAVPPANWPKVKAICDAEDVEATVIGTFADHKKLILRYQGNQVGELEMDFLHNGLPKSRKRATWSPKQFPEPAGKTENLSQVLYRLLGHPNIASKEWVIRQYDHEVQGGSVVKPLTGVNDGPSDAAVFRPLLASNRGIAVGCGINPNFGQIDPYWMAACCIDEAIRNVVAVGGDPRVCAILDNFCWDSCNTEEKLGTLVRAAEGCFTASKAFGTPFISGKDSLNNEFVTETGERIAIPPTLLISAMAIVPDVRKCITMSFKTPGSGIYIIGLTKPELGGSHYFALDGFIGNSVPKVDFKIAKKIFAKVFTMIRQRLLTACHDCSEGGLAVSLAEMAFAANLGVKADLTVLSQQANIPQTDILLFSESPSRFIVEVPAEKESQFLKAVTGLPVCKLGTVDPAPQLEIIHEKTIINEPLKNLSQAWKTGVKIQ